MAARIRVLVIDDAPLMRQIIGDTLNAAPDMFLAGTAASGEEAVALLKTAEVDVVTLDVRMPGMDGLATLEAILAVRKLPVIMASTLVQAGAAITLDALERGAMDYVAKPEGGAAACAAFAQELLRKIRSVAGIDVSRILRIRGERRSTRGAATGSNRVAAAFTPPTVAFDASAIREQCIALGISTGGPPALARLFGDLRPPVPPLVVVQHMPKGFTQTLAWRLNSISALTVREAQSGDLLRPNHAYIAPGGRHLELRRRSGGAAVILFDAEPVSGHRPSVDVMMRSAAAIYGPTLLGVIMTGMGRDGADGCGAVRAGGGFVLGQDEMSSDVYGMNKVAWVEGHVDQQFSLADGATAITNQVTRLARGRQPVR